MDTYLYKRGKNGKMEKVFPSINSIHRTKAQIYFFLIHDSMLPQFKDCEAYTHIHPLQPIFIKVDNKVYVRFLWECVVLFANQDQIDVFDDLRQQYVNYLLVESCSDKHKCDMQIFKRIGSRAQKSDIDYNIESLYSYEIIRRIMIIHKKHFRDDLSDIFDLNFYGSIINYEFSKPKEDYRQTIWSYLRFVEIIEHLPESQKLLITDNLPSQDKKLYIDTHVKLNEMEQTYKTTEVYVNYAKFIKKYHENSQSTQDAYELFSTSKYFERESYRSVGAFLFVVNKSKKISVPMLIDCVYDNLGFIAEITIDVTMCNIGKYIYRLVRIPKYVARCLEAIKLLRTKQQIKNKRDDDIKRILRFCDKLNHKRKNSINIFEIYPDIYKFITIFTGKKGNKIKEFIDQMENDTENARIELLMGIYKKLRMFIVKN